MPSQETKVRLIHLGDAAAIATHRTRDAEAFSRWEPEQPKSFYAVSGQAQRIAKLLDEHAKGQTWPGVVLVDGVVAGQVTVGTILRQPFLRKGSIGYWIGSVFQNHGHATRAVAMVLDVMANELDLHRAEASTRLENVASQKALRRNGFRPYGIAHEHIFIDGGWRDGILWERTLQP